MRARSQLHGHGQTRTLELKSAVTCCLAAVLLLAGCCLGFWNEGRAVARDRVLYEGLERVVMLPAVGYYSPDNEGRLLHASGELSVSGWCHDQEFGLRLRAYRMRRIVEMFQWVEDRTERQVTLSDGTSRTESVPEYHTAWLPYLVDSSRFADTSRRRHNPPAMPHPSLDFSADGASLGAYELTEVFLAKLVADKSVTDPGPDTPLEDLSRRGYRWLSGFLYAPGSAGHRPSSPEVGDARIRWTYGGGAREAVSVIGKQVGHSLMAYHVGGGVASEPAAITDEDDLSTIALLTDGYRSPRQMFGSELARSRLQLWALRIAAWLLMLAACAAVVAGRARPLLEAVLGRAAPLRPLLALPTATLCMSLSGSLALAVTGLAWARHRPAMALALLAVCAAPPLAARFGPAVARRLRPLLAAARLRASGGGGDGMRA